MTAITWGWSVDDAADRLMEESAKAHANGKAYAELTARNAALLVGMGLLCSIGSLCFFVALKHTTAANVSQFHYTQLITGALMAWLVWRQTPGLYTILGAVLIIVSGIYIALNASQQQHSVWISPPIHPD